MRPPFRTQNPPHQVIHIQPLAAAKPEPGAPCNGCGVCCLAEPCPLGVLLSRSRAGPCKVLRWEASVRQYRCGAMGAAAAGLGLWARLRLWIAARWIAAGVGCDCDLQPLPSATITHSKPQASEAHHD